MTTTEDNSFRHLPGESRAMNFVSRSVSFGLYSKKRLLTRFKLIYRVDVPRNPSHRLAFADGRFGIAILVQAYDKH